MNDSLFIGLDTLLAGVSLLGGLLAIWLSRRSPGEWIQRWSGLVGISSAAGLAFGATVMSRPGGTAGEIALVGRSVAYALALICALCALAALGVRMPLRTIVLAVAALTVLRVTLWVPTELFADHDVPAGDWPHYGPLTWLWLVFIPVLAWAGWAAYRQGDLLVRRFVLVAIPGTIVLWAWATASGDGAVGEQLRTLAVVPGTVGVLVLAAGRLDRSARLRELLVARQTTLTNLGNLAVHADDIDTVRRSAELELRRHLDNPDVEVQMLATSTREHPRPDGAVVVTGRRDVVRAVRTGAEHADTDARHFVQSVLQIVAAAADRFTYDAELTRRATRDDLTGLPNRLVFIDRLADRLTTGGRSDVVVVYVVSLTGLDEYGTDDGVERRNFAVAVAADALDHLVEASGTVARLSTSAFGVLERAASDATADVVSARLVDLEHALATRLSDRDRVRVAIGAVTARAGVEPEQVLRDAMAAAGRAGANGGGVEIVGDALRTQVDERTTLHGGLQRAIERDEFDLRYQPIVTARSRRLVGYEALGRWRRDGAVVPPDRWVPVAEHGGLIERIGGHLLGLACRDQPTLGVPVSVNVSPVQLAAPGFADTVRAALGDTRPDHLVLEVTEGVIVTDQHAAVATLEDLQRDGIRIALDDFGTSYSSLSKLIDLPIDILKIDSSFVERLDTASGRSVVEAIVTLARTLGKATVAEGVEDERQAAALAELGVDSVQGFIVGRPMSVERARSGRERPVPGA